MRPEPTRIEERFSQAVQRMVSAERDSYLSRGNRVALMVGSFLLCGRAIPGNHPYVQAPSPPSEEVRAQLGNVRVAEVPGFTTIQITQPLDKDPAAAIEAGRATVGWLSAGGRSQNGLGAVAVVLLTPVVAAGGAIYGEIEGMNGEHYEKISSTLNRVVQELEVTARLTRAVREATRLLADTTEVIPTNLDNVTITNGQGSPFPNAQGPRSALEFTSGFSLVGASNEINPPLTLIWSVFVRLVRSSDGAELFSGEFRYFGEVHKLGRWAANDGRLLHDGIERASPLLAQQIAEQIFLVYALPDSPGQHRTPP